MNRRGLFQAIEEALALGTSPLSLLIIDLDHFKRVNDTHGHACGDHVLREFACVCREIVRAGDAVGRLGGEEFAIVLPRTGVAPRQNWTPGAVLRAGSPMANILGHHLWTVSRNLPGASIADSAAINRLVAGVVAGAFATEAARARTLVRADGPATLEAIRDYILRHLGSPNLTPVPLCRRFGCSRSQLYRLFSPKGGIASLIRSARLERCRDELMNARAGERIVDVAMRWGFGSQSHFCRLFRQAFGMSPGEAVELGRSAGPTRCSSGGTSRHQPAFHRWLRELRAA